jgi:hypothetical protein
MTTAPNLFGESEGKLSVERVAPVAAKDGDRSTVTDIVNWLVRNGPLWARIPAVAAVLCVFLAPITTLVWRPNPERWLNAAGQTEMSQLQMAASTAAVAHQNKLDTLFDKVDLSKSDRIQLKAEFGDMKHQLQHLNNPQDQAPWKIFAKTSPKDYFGFKLFPSDHCLLIARVEQGQADTQWVRDPIGSTGNTNPDSKIEQDAALRTGGEDRLAALRLPANAAMLLMSGAASGLLERGGGPPKADPVQAGCIYPHPGTPQETWGANLNQCQQPVIRVYGDGCSHVQIYDHCAKTWGPVVWQACAASHHP